MEACCDPFIILGLEVDCSARDVICAYRNLARLHHPDKGGQKEVFQKVSAAYELLSSDGGLAKQAAAAKKKSRAEADDSQRQAEKEEWAARAAKAAAAWRELCKEHAKAKAEKQANVNILHQKFETARRWSPRDQQHWEELQDPEAWKRWREELAEEYRREMAHRLELKKKWIAQHNARTSSVHQDQSTLLRQQLFRGLSDDAASCLQKLARKNTRPSPSSTAKRMSPNMSKRRHSAGITSVQQETPRDPKVSVRDSCVGSEKSGRPAPVGGHNSEQRPQKKARICAASWRESDRAKFKPLVATVLAQPSRTIAVPATLEGLGHSQNGIACASSTAPSGAPKKTLCSALRRGSFRSKS